MSAHSSEVLHSNVFPQLFSYLRTSSTFITISLYSLSSSFINDFPFLWRRVFWLVRSFWFSVFCLSQNFSILRVPPIIGEMAQLEKNFKILNFWKTVSLNFDNLNIYFQFYFLSGFLEMSDYLSDVRSFSDNYSLPRFGRLSFWKWVSDWLLF